MEPQKILECVERTWQFVPANYPVVANIRGQQYRTFALDHILKHIKDSLSVLSQGHQGIVLMSLAGVHAELRKLLLSSIRYAQMAEAESLLERFERHIHFWIPTLEITEVRSSFNHIKAGRPFSELLRSLSELFDDGLHHTEEFDHGNMTNFEALQNDAFEFLFCALNMAKMFGYRREEFEEWLVSRDAVA